MSRPLFVRFCRKKKGFLQMDLNLIRGEIDKIDEQLAALYERRTQLASEVAKYKKEHDMPVLQKGREDQILEKVGSAVSPELKNGAQLLFTTLMDLSKCRQQQLLTQQREFATVPSVAGRPVAATVTKGSYSADACEKFFGGNCDVRYFRNFDEVFEAVERGEVDYGVLPIENSTAGDVSTTYDLMGKHHFFICRTTKVHIDHVLAVKPGVDISEVTEVRSHEMALRQCSGFLAENGAKTTVMRTTAEAAEYVAGLDADSCGAICSRSCAKIFGLTVAAENIADIKDNFTRFILISNRLEVPEDASVISLSLTIPHTPGSLYRLLTRFAYCGLNLSRIESKPIPSGFSDVKDDAFDVVFYLDFIGSIRSADVVKLLNNLEDELKYYRFLGNYAEI